MVLSLISDLSWMNGVRVKSSDIIIPKEYTNQLLYKYPITSQKVAEFFADHPRARCVVIIDFEGV